MKNLIFIFILIPIIGLSQQHGNDHLKRDVIDSIHIKRLCIEYPGINQLITTQEAYAESEFVFTGRVTEIIRIEKLEPQDFGIDSKGTLVATDFEASFQYWYIIKTNKIYKGEKKDEIKIHAKIFSTISPLLMLNKKYLIYAKTEEFQDSPYIYCGGNSCHLEYAENDIKELEEITKN